jgi:hypothetical protein
MGVSVVGLTKHHLSVLKIAIFHLKCLKLMPACIVVALMGPSHCFNSNGCSYLVLQLLYHLWLPRSQKVFYILWGNRLENGIGDPCSP